MAAPIALFASLPLLRLRRRVRAHNGRAVQILVCLVKTFSEGEMKRAHRFCGMFRTPMGEVEPIPVFYKEAGL
jgi:hypothetical protein